MEKGDLNAAIGYRIKLARENAGMTQERLAEHIQRSTQFISTVERGAAGPSLETVIRICEVLNTSSEWILRGRQSSADVELIASKFSELSDQQLVYLDKLADNLLMMLKIEKKQ